MESCIGCDFALLATDAFLVAGLLALACCVGFWSLWAATLFVAPCFAETGFTCAVFAFDGVDDAGVTLAFVALLLLFE